MGQLAPKRFCFSLLERCQPQPVSRPDRWACRPYALVEHSLAHWTSQHSGEAVPRGLLRNLLAESVNPCAVRLFNCGLHAGV